MKKIIANLNEYVYWVYDNPAPLLIGFFFIVLESMFFASVYVGAGFGWKPIGYVLFVGIAILFAKFDIYDYLKRR